MTVPDRSLFLLQEAGIRYSMNEMLAIRTHDGLYEEANKAYLISRMPESRPKSVIVYILHQADMVAARIEFEHEYLDELAQPKKQEIKKTTTQSTFKKPSAQEKAYKNLGNKNSGLADLLKNL
jgi:RNase adaptor protein for sRNA GlmZ degradation